MYILERDIQLVVLHRSTFMCDGKNACTEGNDNFQVRCEFRWRQFSTEKIQYSRLVIQKIEMPGMWGKNARGEKNNTHLDVSQWLDVI